MMRGFDSILGMLLLATLSSLAPGSARAHEYWLAPSTYAAGASDTVDVGALSGVKFVGERKTYAPARVVRFVARARREVDLVKAARPGDTTWVRFAPGDHGGAAFGYESNFAAITLDSAEFESYLVEEGLDEALVARRARGDKGPARERYRRSIKSWISGDDAKRATKILGLPCEIVPLSAPGTKPRLRVRVLYAGKPYAGAWLRAWRQPLGAGGRPTDPVRRDSVSVAWSGRTDARGEAEVPVVEAGEWLLATVHMTRSRDLEAAEWESTWASLTFARR